MILFKLQRCYWLHCSFLFMLSIQENVSCWMNGLFVIQHGSIDMKVINYVNRTGFIIIELLSVAGRWWLRVRERNFLPSSNSQEGIYRHVKSRPSSVRSSSPFQSVQIISSLMFINVNI